MAGASSSIRTTGGALACVQNQVHPFVEGHLQSFKPSQSESPVTGTPNVVELFRIPYHFRTNV